MSHYNLTPDIGWAAFLLFLFLLILTACGWFWGRCEVSLVSCLLLEGMTSGKRMGCAKGSSIFIFFLLRSFVSQCFLFVTYNKLAFVLEAIIEGRCEDEFCSSRALSVQGKKHYAPDFIPTLVQCLWCSTTL